ncbi:hypothetical protein UB46_40645, partial [Burkholderiaceae bacterium 16]
MAGTSAPQPAIFGLSWALIRITRHSQEGHIVAQPVRRGAGQHRGPACPLGAARAQARGGQPEHFLEHQVQRPARQGLFLANDRQHDGARLTGAWQWRQAVGGA